MLKNGAVTVSGIRPSDTIGSEKTIRTSFASARLPTSPLGPALTTDNTAGCAAADLAVVAARQAINVSIRTIRGPVMGIGLTWRCSGAGQSAGSGIIIWRPGIVSVAVRPRSSHVTARAIRYTARRPRHDQPPVASVTRTPDAAITGLGARANRPTKKRAFRPGPVPYGFHGSREADWVGHGPATNASYLLRVRGRSRSLGAGSRTGGAYGGRRSRIRPGCVRRTCRGAAVVPVRRHPALAGFSRSRARRPTRARPCAGPRRRGARRSRPLLRRPRSADGDIRRPRAGCARREDADPDQRRGGCEHLVSAGRAHGHRRSPEPDGR